MGWRIRITSEESKIQNFGIYIYSLGDTCLQWSMMKEKERVAGSKVHWVHKGKNHHSMLKIPGPILDASIF